MNDPFALSPADIEKAMAGQQAPAPSAPPAPVSAPRDAFALSQDDINAAINADSAGKLGAMLPIMATADPKQEAANAKLARDLGIPVEALPSAALAKSEVYMARYNPAKIAKEAPGTAMWLTKNESNAKQGAGALDVMVAQERAFRQLQMTHKKSSTLDGGSATGVARSFLRGLTSALRGFDVAAVDESSNILSVIDRIEAGELRSDQDLAKATPYWSLFAGVGRSPEKLRQLRAMHSARLAENITSADVRGRKLQSIQPEGALSDFYQTKGWGPAWDVLTSSPGDAAEIMANIGFESLGVMAPTMPLAVVGGMAGGARGLSAGTFASSTLTEYSTALADGLREIGVDTTDVNAVRAAIMSPAFADLRKKASVKAPIVGAFDAAGARMAGVRLRPSNVGNLAAQTGVQMTTGAAGEVVGSVASGQEIHPASVIAEAIGEIPGAGIDLATLSASRIASKQMRDSASGEPTGTELRARYEALGQSLAEAQRSPLRADNPTAFKDHIRALKDEDGDADVYINAGELANTFAQAGVTPEEVQRKMPAVASQMAEASRLGTEASVDIRVPIEDFLTNFPDDMARGVVEKGIAESQQRISQEADRQKELTEKLVAEADKDDALRTERENLRATLAADLTATGRFTSPVTAANVAPIVDFYTVMAKRQGISVSEAYARDPLDFATMTRGKKGGALGQSQETLLTAIADLRVFAAANRVGLEMQPFKDGLEITDLYAETPGTGAGTGVMRQVEKVADGLGVPVRLRPEQPRNKTFYARFGFEKDGVNHGFMVRAPRGLVPQTETARSPEYAGAAAVVKARADELVKTNLEELKAQYVAANTNKHGVLVVDTDLARSLFPDYVADPARFASAVHSAASAIAKAVYADAVKAEVKAGHVPVAVFTGGGTGAGKSSMQDIENISAEMNTAHVIRDTTLAGYDGAKESIEMTLAAGKFVRINYVARDPVASLVEGALPRAMREGRPVPLSAHLSTHTRSRETIRRLAEEYKDNHRVAITIIDNTGAEGTAKVADLDAIAQDSYNDLEARALQALETEYANGKISTKIYEATKGDFQLSGMEREGDSGGTGFAQQGLGQSAFYSALEREIPALIKIANKNGLVKAEQAKAWIAARQKEGKFKAAEVEAVGLYEWLDLQTDSVPVADIVEFVANNGVKVEEILLSDEEVDASLSVRIGRFETEEPDESYLEETAREYYLDGARQEIANREDIPPEEVDEEEAMRLAVDRVADEYWADPDTPQYANASVDFGGQTYTYSVSYHYGETEIYRTAPTQDEVYLGRAISEDGIESRIRDDVAELAPSTSGEGGPTKFGDWRLEGGSDYRELLLTLPKNERTYRGPHFDQANIAAHVRFDTREGPNGEKVLFIQEIQSDWGQQGKKKGFRQQKYTRADVKVLSPDDGRGMAHDSMWYVAVPGNVYQFSKAVVPDAQAAAQRAVDKLNHDTGDIALAPFVTSTKEWTALAVKRMLRYAAENGFDSVAWTTGQQQADRYSLSKHIGKLRYEGEMLKAYAPNGAGVWNQVVPEDKIADFVGKETADKLLAQPFGSDRGIPTRELAGLDLEVGGEGMKGYYDKIVPQVANEILKRLNGGKVGQIAGIGDLGVQPGFALTPELKEKVLSGLPLFSRDRLAEFDPENLTITLLKGANLSSVLHEASHAYLTILTRVAAREGASQAVRDDADVAMKWFGIEGDTPEARLTKWLGMSINDQREFHEQWAESNERWMLEGKAPAVEMQSLFARFRSWMLRVYESMEEFLIKNPRAGKLNDEIRGLFGRLLASEEAIKFAEQTRGYAALFQNEQEAGTSPETFKSYVQLGEEATLEGVTKMQNRSLKDVRWLSNAKDKAVRALQRQEKDARKKIKDEVTQQVMAEPVNQARTFFTKGETTDPVTGEQVKAIKGYKLDTSAIKEMYPETTLGNPDLTKLRGMTGPDGIHPDLAAQMFGFSSGDALVRELIDGENRFDKINGLVDQRMLEAHGELIDPRSIELAAEEAIHNEARARFLATGLKLLTKMPGAVRDIAKAAKLAAENAIAGKKIKDLRPLQYLAAETRSNKEALKLAVNDPKGAVQAQRAALLNNRLAKAAADAVEEVQQIIRYLKKFENAGTRKAIDLEYIEQIDGLLAPFDLSTGLSLKEIERRKSLTAWVEEQEALGFQPAIDVEAIERAKLKSYKDMTVEELRGFVDSIKQVEHMGRLKKKLLTAKDQREFATRMAEADASIRMNANRTVEETATATDVAGRLAEVGKMILAAHRKFSSFMREMDGGKDGGVMWELFSRPMNEASDNETRMRAEAAKEMAAIFAPIQSIIRERTVVGNLYARKQLVPGTNFSMTHEQRVMFAMNWGNEGNRQRLLDGGLSGKRAMSTGEAQAILDTLTKEEWDFVQHTLDYIGSYKDRISELERTLTGVEPKWIAPSPIQTKFGTYAGGYFPAKYDAKLSMRSASFEAQANTRAAAHGAFGVAATRHSYIKARADKVKDKPLLLSFDVITTHVNDVIHRLSFEPWRVDTIRALRALEDPIRTHYGPEVLDQLHKTVEAVTAGDAPATEGVDMVLNHLRAGSTVVGMGWRVMTGLQQPSGLAQSWERVGKKWIAKGVAEFAARPFEAAEMVNAKSSFMRDRARTMQREINEVVNTLRVGKELSAVKLSYFSFIAKMQKGVDIPTWLGAYEKALAQMNYENAASEEERKSLEDRAVAMADQAVRDSQGSGMIADLAGVQRGHPAWKLFTNFYSYFSTTYNRNVELFRRTDFKSPTELAVFAADFAIINALPALFSFALKEMLKGDCDGDLECLAGNYAHEQAGYMFGQMLPLREVGAAFNIATGGPNFGYTGPAGVRFMADVTNLATQTAQGELDLAWWKAMNRVSGGLLHYPAGQINATLDGIVAIENGEVDGVSILPALLVGPPHK